MLTPSKIEGWRIYVRVPTYLVLMLHGSTLIPANEFVLVFIIAPISLLAIYHGLIILFDRNRRNDVEILERTGIPPERNIFIFLFFYTFLPIAIVFSGMIYAEIHQSYESLFWIPIWFGSFTLNDLVSRFRMTADQ